MSSAVADPLIPDPQRGIFETMLVVEGRLLELDAHLERMAAGLEAIFDASLPFGAEALAANRACDIKLGRLRLAVAPDGEDGLRAEVVAAPVEPALIFPSPERPLALHIHLVEGGLGAHKWADRRLLEAAESAAPAGSIPLLIDRDETVLEVSRGNIFLALGGVLLTPPTDGRILPGIARQRAIELAAEAGVEVREEAVALERLAHADEVFLTGSVRGVEPVSSLEGTDLPSGGPLSRRIAAALRQRWLGPDG
jgi:para-aminobenzoate synthetase/4-amino-4-deoxychorismate lyase